MPPSNLPASMRSNLLAPLDSRGRVVAVEERIAEAIQAGLFADGEQLPKETELASHLGVSTVTLRDALSGLRRRGLVETRRGRHGGTFVRAPAAEVATRLLDRLAGLSVDDLRDQADHHAAVAGQAAALAAERSSQSDMGRMERHLERLEGSATLNERRAADVRFHYELAASSRSLRLTAIEMEVRTQLGAVLDLVMQDEAAAAAARADHRTIFEAVRRRDPSSARALAAAHVEREMGHVIAMRLGPRRRPGHKPSEASARHVFDAVRSVVDEVTRAVSHLRAQLLQISDGVDPARDLTRKDLGVLRERILEQLAEHDLIAGCGVVFAHGALSDAPRWLEWWLQPPGRDPERLTTCLDPGDPAFYDYEQADWFQLPRSSGGRWIAGPFVDYSGTNERIFTLTLPMVRDEAFLGVAGADLAITSIESVARPPLMDLAGEAMLVNGSGRVIASNTARHPVSTLWPGGAEGGLGELCVPAITPGVMVWRDDELPWALVTVPSSEGEDG